MHCSHFKNLYQTKQFRIAKAHFFDIIILHFQTKSWIIVYSFWIAQFIPGKVFRLCMHEWICTLQMMNNNLMQFIKDFYQWLFFFRLHNLSWYVHHKNLTFTSISMPSELWTIKSNNFNHILQCFFMQNGMIKNSKCLQYALLF